MRRGRTVLRVNLDETAVCLYPGQTSGAVFVSRKRQREGRGQSVPGWKRRCCLTHVGVVCDQSRLQPRMPQFIIGNERTFRVKELGALQRACPRNVTLLRQTSAWSNGCVTARIVRALAAAVRAAEGAHGTFQIILLLDAAKIHYVPTVLRACRAAGVWPVLVPAKMTYLLQPLDTHAFASYKAYLKRAYQVARMTSVSGSGDLQLSEFMQCVYDTIRQVLQGRGWTAAFEGDGFGARQLRLSPRVRHRLQLDAAVDVTAARPSDGQLRACFPRRARLAPAMIWALYAEPVARPVGLRLGPAPKPAGGVAVGRVARGSAASSSAARGVCVPSVPSVPVLYGRTRAETLRMKVGGMDPP